MSRRRDRRGPIRNRLEYIGIRLAQALFQAIPERTSRRVGRFCGHLGFLCVRRHRRIAIQNVEQALRVPRAQARRIAADSFGHLGEMLAEMAWATRWLRDPRAQERVVLNGIDAVRTHLATGRGAVIATGHLGNWEQTSFLLPPAGIPFSTIARPIDNPLLWELVQQRRTALGQGLILRKGAAAESARQIAAGRLVAVIFDQRSKQNSIVVPFFGRDALTSIGPAMIAFRNRCPIFFSTTYRHRDGRQVFDFDPPILPRQTGDLRADVRALTIDLNGRLEAAIRRHPEQYLWAHNRWRGVDEPRPG